MRVQPETASTVSDTHAGAVLRRDGWVPDQAERWSIYCFAICVSSEDRTANFQCAGDLIADGLEESFCVFRVQRSARPLSGRYGGAQGLHTTGDWMGNGRKNAWIGLRVVDWPSSGRVSEG